MLTRIPHCLGPMRSKAFRIAWTLNVISCTGSQIQYLSEKLQMSRLTRSTFLMALIEVGTALPIMFLGFSAGVLSDTTDRRKLLLATHIFMLTCAAILSGLTFWGLTTTSILLATAFLIGTGSALSMPTYQALVPELLVEDESLVPEGTILTSISYNISRMIGPIIGGYVYDIFGAHWAFMLNALSFLGIIIALVIWLLCCPRSPSIVYTRKPFQAAMRVGFNHVRHNRLYKAVVLRAMGYSWFGGVIFSLVPALIMRDMGLNSRIYGLLMSCIGTGAVTVIVTLPSLRRKFKITSIFVGFGLMATVAQGIIANTNSIPTIGVCLFLAGMSWLAVISTVIVTIQLTTPAWLKARAFGIYYMAAGLTTTLGAIFWGKLADHLGVRTTMNYATVGMLAALIILSRVKIDTIDSKMTKDLVGQVDILDNCMEQ